MVLLGRFGGGGRSAGCSRKNSEKQPRAQFPRKFEHTLTGIGIGLGVVYCGRCPGETGIAQTIRDALACHVQDCRLE